MTTKLLKCNILKKNKLITVISVSLTMRAYVNMCFSKFLSCAMDQNRCKWSSVISYQCGCSRCREMPKDSGIDIHTFQMLCTYIFVMFVNCTYFAKTRSFCIFDNTMYCKCVILCDKWCNRRYIVIKINFGAASRKLLSNFIRK